MKKTIKRLLLLIVALSLMLVSACKEPTEDQKIIQRLQNIPEDAKTIDLKDYFTFEWDEVVIPSCMNEKTVEDLMGQSYILYQNLDESMYITPEMKRVDESSYDALIFFHNKELVHEFYYHDFPGNSFGFSYCDDYVIQSDDCEFSVERAENKKGNKYLLFHHIRNDS